MRTRKIFLLTQQVQVKGELEAAVEKTAEIESMREKLEAEIKDRDEKIQTLSKGHSESKDSDVCPSMLFCPQDNRYLNI